MDKSLLTVFALAGLTVLLLAAMLWDSMCEHPESRIDDMTEINMNYLLNDSWYRDTLVDLLDSLEDKHDRTK